MSTLDPLLKRLSEAPEAQINGEITRRIARLVGCDNEIVATELKEIRDDCIAKALASSFAFALISQAVEVAEVKG